MSETDSVHSSGEGHEPLPHSIPRPTLWPGFLALGATLLLWGLVTSWIVGMVGGALLIISLGGWIKEINYERSGDQT